MRSRHGWLVCLLIANLAHGYEVRRAVAVEDPAILGTQANAEATRCTITDDAAIIGFLSGATNLTVSDQNGRVDSFLDTGVGLVRASRGLGGSELPLDTLDLAVSADGQFVAFRLGSDFTAASGAQWNRIYRLNRNNGNVIIVAGSAAVAPGTGPGLAISNDGRYIAYASSTNLLVPGDTDADTDVFRFDAQTGTTVLVSVDTGSPGADGDVNRIAMDGSGNLIAFDSNEADLVASDTNGASDVFVRNVTAATTIRVSKRSNGNEANGASEVADISDDGAYVLFSSLASNLDSTLTDGNVERDVFRHRLSNGTTRRVSLDSAGAEIAEASVDGAISGDGQFIWLISYRGGNRPQVWRKNLGNDNLLQITNSIGSVFQVDTDLLGTSACFIGSSRSTDLVVGDSNARSDVYRATITTGPTVGITREGQPASAIPSSVLASDSRLLDIDDAGRTLVVLAQTPQLDADTFPEFSMRDQFHAYLVNRFDGAVGSACRNAAGDNTDGSCRMAGISGDGRYVFFESDGTNLHPDVPDAAVNWTQIFRRDQQTGAVDLITRNTVGVVASNGAGSNQALASNASGSRVVFQSSANDLVVNDTNNLPDLFLWDASAGIRRISVRNNGTQANDAPYDRPYMSADGEYVVFAHAADNLVAGDNNGRVDLFLYQVSSSSLTRIAQPATQTSDLARPLDFSRDGQWLAFYSAATQYTDPDNANLFLWNRSTGVISEITNGQMPGELLTLPVSFLRDNSGLIFGVDSDPSPNVLTQTLYRRYFASGAPFAVLTVPSVANPEMSPHAAGAMRIATDQSAFLEYNWPLALTDNNGGLDIGELQSGYGFAEFATATIDVDESAGSVNIEVFRRFGQAFDADVLAVPANGSAVNGSDFNASPTGLLYLWQDGMSGMASATLTITDDATTEPTEQFTLSLADYGLIQPGAITTLTVNIIDNDDVLFADGFEQ